MEEKTIKSVGETEKKKIAKNQEENFLSEVDFSKMEVNVEEMFKKGVYFGHHKSRRNPKMDEYIFATRNGINILDLQKTAVKLKQAMDFISQTVSAGEDILFVGTKKQAKKLVVLAAKACQMPYISERWLGGTFTNFPVIASRTRYLRDGLESKKRGEFSKYTKFEAMKKSEELERLEKRMGGIKNMLKLPGAVFVTSVPEDSLAVKEAKKKNIPVIALVDTNVNPDEVDYPIPANEDAVSSLKLLLGYIVKAVLEGKEKKEVAKDKIAQIESK